MRCKTMATLGFIPLVILLTACPVAAFEKNQDDWSAGPDESLAAGTWNDHFETSLDVSWRSVAGQLALSGDRLGVARLGRITPRAQSQSFIKGDDVDGDGHTDLVINNYSNDAVYFWKNLGTSPVTWETWTLTPALDGVQSVDTGDIDGDGNTDILAGSIDGMDLSWWKNDGTDPDQWQKVLIDDNYHAQQVIAVDLDQDGRMDVVAASTHEGTAWWRNGGGDPIDWQRQEILDLCPLTSGVGVGDIDGDGDMDVMGSGGQVIVLWRNGGGSPIAWSAEMVDPELTVSHWVEAGDLDNDGDMDLVGVSWNPGIVRWYDNGGGTPINWTAHDIATERSGALQARIGDFDGDGDLDVTGQSQFRNEVYWWENSDDAATWTQRRLAYSFNRPWPAATCDVDGNGSLDIVAGSSTIGTVSWWTIADFKPAGDLESAVLDLGQSFQVQSVSWTADQPAGTGLSVQVRTGDDASDLGDWSDEISTPGDLTQPAGRYIQYKVNLWTTDIHFSPILKDIMFELSGATGVPGSSLPKPAGRLEQNAPNPFNPATEICFTLDRSANVQLRILDLQGRAVAELIPGVRYATGRHTLTWSGCGDGKRPLPSGTYLCSLKMDDQLQLRKMTLVK